MIPKRLTNHLPMILNAFFKVPYTIDAYLLACDTFRVPPVYDACWRHLSRWLKELDESPKDESPFPGERVLVFCADHFWTNYLCSVAVLLASRGIKVDFSWILREAPYPNIPYKSLLHWQRLSSHACKNIHHPLIELYDLANVPATPANEDMKHLAEQQAQIDVSYLLQRERINIDADNEDAFVFRDCNERNLETILKMASFLQNRRYDRIIMPSGGVLEHGAVYRYACAKKIPVSTIETCDVHGRMWVSNDMPVVAINTLPLWTQDEPHVLSEQRRIRVQKILNTRQTPSSKELVIEYQKTEIADSQDIRIKLGLDSRKKTILMCPNVPFDAIFYMGGKNSFSGMWDWLIRSIQFFIPRQDCQLVIRCHPGEPHYRTKETTQTLIAEHYKTLPDHVIVVPPQAAINTYSIMQTADVGVVYASTTGLEMAMRGIPVICGNPVQHYNGKGFTIDPLTRDDYYHRIEELLSTPRSIRLTDRQIELAWCYADLYFNRWYLPFPWHVMSLWKDMKIWPMKRMLSEEGRGLYNELLDRLTGKATGNGGAH